MAVFSLNAMLSQVIYILIVPCMSVCDTESESFHNDSQLIQLSGTRRGETEAGGLY